MRRRKKIDRYEVPSGTQEERIAGMLEQLELEKIAHCFMEDHKYVRETKGTILDFLENILEKQILDREQNRVERRNQLAQFPIKKTLKDFDFPFQPTLSESLINEFASCRFIRSGENIFFIGQPGVGKTHLSIALGLEAIEKGFETRFLTLDKLIEYVEKTDVDSSPKLLRTLMRPRLLILDDIDFYNTGKITSEFLFKLVVGRYNDRSSTILTSNRKPSEWGELFGKERASAALDRLIERATPVVIDGPSYRMKSKLTSKA